VLLAKEARFDDLCRPQMPYSPPEGEGAEMVRLGQLFGSRHSSARIPWSINEGHHQTMGEA
jgi:hypothetical protein